MKKDKEKITSKANLERALFLQCVLNWDVLHLNTRVEY